MKNQSLFNRIKLIIPALLLSASLSAQVANPAADPAIESHIKSFLNILNSGGGKPMEQMAPIDTCAVLTGVQSSVKVDLSRVENQEKTISVNVSQIKLNIVRPAGNKAKLPVFMFFHGGGWVLGDYPAHQLPVGDLVLHPDSVGIFVNYTPSPEAQYPLAINQAYQATAWVAAHGNEINVEGNRLAVAGNSAGGNMVAVVALMAKEKKA